MEKALHISCASPKTRADVRVGVVGWAWCAEFILSALPELPLVPLPSDPHCGLDQSEPERLHLPGAVG